MRTWRIHVGGGRGIGSGKGQETQVPRGQEVAGKGEMLTFYYTLH